MMIKNKKLPLTQLMVMLAGLLAFTFIACQNPATPTPKRSLQDEIRYYFYENQPTKGQEFVNWANKNLKSYSSRKIYQALISEGESHAKQGHPNAIAIISYAAAAWAKEKQLQYDIKDWQKLQDEAVKNQREDLGDVELWPSNK